MAMKKKILCAATVAAMGVPVVMVVMPLFGIVAQMNLLNHQITNRLVLVFLYIGINVPYITIFLLTFFANLSKTYEEAAAIDSCENILEEHVSNGTVRAYYSNDF